MNNKKTIKIKLHKKTKLRNNILKSIAGVLVVIAIVASFIFYGSTHKISNATVQYAAANDSTEHSLVSITTAANDFSSKDLLTTSILNSSITSITDSETNSGLRILCVGDSITEGTGCLYDSEMYCTINNVETDISGWNYPKVLQYLTGADVYNHGVCGETAYGICINEAVYGMYLEDSVTLYSDIPAYINITDYYGNYIYQSNFSGYPITGDYPLDVVYIDDVRYQITYDEYDNLYISPFDASEYPVILKAGSKIVPASAYETPQCDVLIIEMGSNGGWYGYDDLIAMYKDLIKNSGCTNYIIVGDTDNPTESYEYEYYWNDADVGYDNTYWEEALEEAFGEHFINMRTYMLQNAFDILEIDPSYEDECDLNVSRMPESIKYDYTHFNSLGYYVYGYGVYQKGIELGYWN